MTPITIKKKILNCLKSGRKNLDEIIAYVGQGPGVSKCLLELEIKGKIKQVPKITDDFKNVGRGSAVFELNPNQKGAKK